MPARLVVPALILILAAGCSSPTRPMSPIDERVTIPVGETALVPSSQVSVRFAEVLEDSRCPADAMCVSPGRAVVELGVVVGARVGSVQLASEPADARGTSVDGVRFEFLLLAPYPWASRPTQPGEYVLTMHVVR